MAVTQQKKAAVCLAVGGGECVCVRSSCSSLSLCVRVRVCVWMEKGTHCSSAGELGLGSHGSVRLSLLSVSV